MKLLVDQNLPASLVPLLAAPFPGSAHVRALRLDNAPDDVVWRFATEHGFTIPTRDDDFVGRVLLSGGPPKVIWVTLPNPSLRQLRELVASSTALIQSMDDPEESASVLVLPQARP